MQSKNLGAQHTGICDSDECIRPSALLVRQGLGDEKEPRAVGGTMHVGFLQEFVYWLLILREHVEVPLSRRRQRFDDIFQRILIRA